MQFFSVSQVERCLFGEKCVLKSVDLHAECRRRKIKKNLWCGSKSHFCFLIYFKDENERNLV